MRVSFSGVFASLPLEQYRTFFLLASSSDWIAARIRGARPLLALSLHEIYCVPFNF